MSDHTSPCGAEAHVHTLHQPLFLRPGLFLVVLDGSGVLLAFDQVIADRAAALLNAHGLLDVPAGMFAPPAADAVPVDLPTPPLNDRTR